MKYPINLQTILPLQLADTLFVGKNFHDLPAIGSTNEFALELLSKSKPPEGTVISARHQFAGRGQIGSGWESEPGKNITLSIILYPAFLQVARQFLLSQCISLAVNDLVGKYFPQQSAIKWPNDIYLNDKKVAGVLIQNVLSGTQVRSSIIGVGININQTVFCSGAPNPTSFKLESGKDTDIAKVVNDLCHFVENRYLKLRSGSLVSLQQDYLRYLYRYQTPAFFQRPTGETFQGKITGVAESGLLEVETVNETRRFDLKEIKFH